ncbi:MAG TPA: glycosyltransferase family 4 protein [Verrucomicrobiota bacterium]|nr:glycosyltransferase family 4 protein [Verrucomicrobiota bacterium]
MAAVDTIPHAGTKPRLVCFVNGIFSEGIGGGDVYFRYMARAAIAAGYPIHFFGGHALKLYLERQGFPMNLTLTDTRMAKLGTVGALAGQFRLLLDFRRRLSGTLRQLDVVLPEDIAYAMSDYWFDTMPLMRCRARTKILYLGMMAPTLKQVLTRGRADVTGSRLPSLYYWMSQRYSLKRFRHCEGGVVTYSHPEMRRYLLSLGYEDSALWYVPNGSDTEAADRVPEQPKQYDVVWAGRVHPQKGVDDLLATFQWLKQQLPDFRAVIIGKSRDALEPVVRQMGLSGNVTFSGLVSEEEKFRLLKCSRVFVMPSRYESWGIVVGEALVSEVPVVAYRLDCYPEVFGDAVRYVQPFDTGAFQRAVEDEVRRQRAGENYLSKQNLPELKKRLSWTAAQESFCGVLGKPGPALQPAR